MTIKEKKPIQLRHELKHSINSFDYHQLSQRLRLLFLPDQHADSHGKYRVSSLYFDTPDDKALRQKIDGVNGREKFRLRYYNNDTSFIRLEKKIKLNNLSGKLSAPLSYDQACSLLAGDIAFLAKDGDPLLAELYCKMKGQLLSPKTIVAYEREAFLYGPGNVRLTLDSRLHTSLGGLNFLDPDRAQVDVSDDLALLEVKYDAFLPDIVRLAVQCPHRRAAAFSKYAACRRLD